MNQNAPLDRARAIMKRNAMRGAALAIVPLASIAAPMKAHAQGGPPPPIVVVGNQNPSGGNNQSGGGLPSGGNNPPGTSNPPSLMLNLGQGQSDLVTGNVEFHLEQIRDAEMPPLPEMIPPTGKEVIEPKDVSKEPKEVVPTEEQYRWNFFAFGSGRFDTLHSSENHPGFASTTTGFTLGLDYRVTEHLVIGAFAGYDHTYASTPLGGSTTLDSPRGGLFGTWFDGPAYVDLITQGAYDSYGYGAGSTSGKIHGDTDGGDFGSLLKGGYDVIKNDTWSFGPTLGLSYSYLGAYGFRAKGNSGTWAINNSDVNSLRSFAGLRAVGHFRLGSVAIRPSVEVDWQHQYLDTIYSDGYHAPNGSFLTSSSNRTGRDGVYVTAGVLAQLSPRWAVFVNYIGDLARANYTSNTVTGGFNLSF